MGELFGPTPELDCLPGSSCPKGDRFKLKEKVEGDTPITKSTGDLIRPDTIRHGSGKLAHALESSTSHDQGCHDISLAGNTPVRFRQVVEPVVDLIYDAIRISAKQKFFESVQVQ